MDRLNEILSLLSSETVLDGEQLGELQDELIGIFDDIVDGKIDGVDSKDVTQLTKVSDAVKAVKAARETLAAEEAEQNQAVAALQDEIHPPEATEVNETEEAIEEILEEPPEIAEGDETVEEPEVAVTASQSLPPLGQVAGSQPAASKPRAGTPQVKIRGTNGPLKSSFEMAQLLADKVNDMVGLEPNGTEKMRLIRIDTGLPESRQLAFDGAERVVPGNDLDKIEAVVSPEAITASGGFCVPTAVMYDIVTCGQAMRPVRDAFPAFGADRGGVRLPEALTIGDFPGAITIHTEAQDILGDPKNCQVVACDTFNEFKTEAIVRCTQFGNFGDRAFPEQTAAVQDVVMAEWARAADAQLLDRIVTASTAVTTPQVFGTARDLIEAVARAASSFRSRFREPDARMRAMLPDWVTSEMSVDLARGLQSEVDFLNITRAQANAMLENAGVTPAYYLDTPSTGISQVFPAQVVGPLNPWPAQVQWGIWDEGHYLFLDGGTLDLGIVRDSVLNRTNDFQMFAESFEGLAPRGCESLWVTSNVCPDGASAAGTEPIVCT